MFLGCVFIRYAIYVISTCVVHIFYTINTEHITKISQYGVSKDLSTTNNLTHSGPEATPATKKTTVVQTNKQNKNTCQPLTHNCFA